MMKRLELSLTVGVTGASILALEILASRILTPGFGSSTHVWGAVLAVVWSAL